MKARPHPLRRLVVVLGDQLDLASSALADFDHAQDMVWMAEVAEESTHVPSSRARTALFLAAMRHFAEELRARGFRVHYVRLDEPGNTGTLAGELRRASAQYAPREIVLTEPGEWRVRQALERAAEACGVPLVVRPDRHFFGSVEDFAQYARSRSELRLEFFYRHLRRRHGVLVEGEAPVGGRWNFDAQNRAAFPPSGPPPRPPPLRFTPDAVTRDVLALVARTFPDHPGDLAEFAWPVTRAQALAALHDFIAHRLAAFGRWQDALWPGEPWLWHSQLSAVLNLKLLDPREVVEAAVRAFERGAAPLASVEGFVRQILGWREFVRGVYWTRMPGYAEANALDAHVELPRFFWTGRLAMPCLADALTQTLRLGYAHHIQRLMVIGLYALLLGVRPRAISDWFLAVYVDAVEWVELPNVLGMSQYADGGVLASKPYVASGQYIARMSGGSYCRKCPFDPALRSGPRACPFTVLYWDFLRRHRERFAAHPRLHMQVRNLDRLPEAERRAIAADAEILRKTQT